jgi:hypothetical protein
MRKIINCLFYIIALSYPLVAQKQALPTDELRVFGLIDSTITVSFSKLCEEPKIDIGDFTITNHAGEFRKKYTQVKGISLLNVLEKIHILSPSPKELSEFYFVFKGSDGYAVVFSWNEIFNTDIGKSVFIVTEINAKNQTESPERVLLISTKDFKTGRRHVKGLYSIEVKRI